MDSLIALFKKNTAASVIIVLLIPISVALMYGAFKSFWVSIRNKKERILIHDFLVTSGAQQTAMTTDDISKGTGLPKDRVIGHCIDHPQIEDAGKRQRSWKLKSDSAA